MRELKFRAWWRDAKMMADVTALGDGWVKFNVEVTSSIPGHTHEVQVLDEGQYDLMQFTGLKDKNGKEIYEGDICRMVFEEDEGGGWHSDRKVRGKVYFDPHWGVKFDCRDKTQRTADTHWSDSQSAVRDYRNVEVIGNIYENSDLLV